MRFYKTGNDFAADIKRQIRAVRRAFRKPGRSPAVTPDGFFAEGPYTLAPRAVPVLTPDGEQAYHEALTVGEDGRPIITRVPSMTVKFFPVPATIRPADYHRLAGVR